jgi:hypothetical protein
MARYICAYGREWVKVLVFFSHGLRLSPLRTAATVWTIVPAADDR